MCLDTLGAGTFVWAYGATLGGVILSCDCCDTLEVGILEGKVILGENAFVGGVGCTGGGSIEVLCSRVAIAFIA